MIVVQVIVGWAAIVTMWSAYLTLVLVLMRTWRSSEAPVKSSRARADVAPITSSLALP